MEPQTRRRRVIPKATTTLETVRSEAAIRASLAAMEQQLTTSFIARADAVRCIQLALVTGMNYLLVGDPGTAKTALAVAAAKHVTDAKYFAPSALGAYTTLGDLVGERDIPALMQGVSRRSTDGRLADVHIAFLDEVFKASDPTQNTLLSLANEREYEGKRTPLHCLGGASNWPEIVAMKPIVKAMWDRWHFRVVVSAVSGKKQLKALMRSGRAFAQGVYVANAAACVSMDELLSIGPAIRAVSIPDSVEDMLVSVYERLQAEKIELSPRRLVQLQHILQASAWLGGRSEVSLQDFSVLTHCVWNKREDLPKVEAVITTVDAAAAQQLMGVVNDCRAQHQTFAREGWTIERAQEFLVNSGNAATLVANSFNGGYLSKSRQSDVKRAIELLEAEVRAIVAMFGEQLF